MPNSRALLLPSPELDYLFLIDQLSGYCKPRDKLTALLRSGEIARIKKGIYVKRGCDCGAHAAASASVLANMIYGPSYVSSEYALEYYGMIPASDGRRTVTSVTSNRNKSFETPVGRFVYKFLPLPRFTVGVRREQLDKQRGFLIATREKALVDALYREKFKSLDELESRLVERLRVEVHSLKDLRLEMLGEIKQRFCSPAASLLWEFVRKLK